MVILIRLVGVEERLHATGIYAEHRHQSRARQRGSALSEMERNGAKVTKMGMRGKWGGGRRKERGRGGEGEDGKG